MRDPRHILITGASSGLGAALALEYAAPEVRLSLHGRDTERLAKVASQARSRGAHVIMYCGDVTDREDMAMWITACDSEVEIDLIIANAGISMGTAGGAESADQAQAIFVTNINGVLNTVLPVLPFMMRRQHGQVAIISSLASFRGFAGAPAYCASKAAVRIYGEALRGEMAPFNIEVNVVCPGFVKTPMTDANPFSMPWLMSAEKAATLIRFGLSNNRARIAFPWMMYALVRILSALPQSLMDFIAARIPKK